MHADIAVGFVIYKPARALTDRLRMISALGYAIYLFDNSPAHGEVREWAKERSDVRYITCGKNVGLGIGMSSLCAQAYYDSYSVLLFFDQDTVFDHQTLSYIERCYRTEVHIHSHYSAIVFNGKDALPGQPAPGFQIKDTLLARSSGSLFILASLKTIDWHDEQYFVDCVDYAFCFRSKRAGFKIGECTTTPGFDHQSEQPDRQYNFFGKHLMLRRYATGRIRDALWSSFKLMGSSIKALDYVFFKEIARSLLIYSGAQILVRILDVADRRMPD